MSEFIGSGKVFDAVTLGATAVPSEPVNVVGRGRKTFNAIVSGAVQFDIEVSQEGKDGPWIPIQKNIAAAVATPLSVTSEAQCNWARLIAHDGNTFVVNAWIKGEDNF